MPTFINRLFLAGVLALLSIPARAQGPPMPIIGPVGLELLRNKAVRTELTLNFDQLSKIDTLFAEMRRKQRELSDKNRDLPKEQRTVQDKELYLTLSASLRKDVAQVLRPPQLKRFVEIQIQHNGAVAFNAAPVQDALKLTGHQKAQYRRLVDEMDKTLEQIARESNGELTNRREDREAFAKKVRDMRQKMAEQWKRSFRKAYSLLTDSQKETWKLLIGEPFEKIGQGPFQ